ncbi:MAG: RNHCP domain-containing protein [Candidatus Zambryskibacteria bacterium]
MSSKFKRKIEDFICENCRAEVKGNGFTNHCPKCLYSKHVDIFPGDRSEKCGGLMEPILADESGGEWSIVHQCLKCGKQSRNKISKEDNFDEVVKISIKKSGLD